MFRIAFQEVAARLMAGSARYPFAKRLRLPISVGVLLAAALAGSIIAGQPAQASTYTCGTDTITNTPQCDGYTKAVTVLQYPNDSSSWDLVYLPAGTRVTVTCWYPGGADGYWDHTTWNSEFGSMTGHVQDSEIDFGGHTPNEIGLPEC